jgi:hypothetical protein
MLEIFFSIIMIMLPVSAFIFKKFLPIFFIALIGAHPYVTAGSLLLALFVRLQDVLKPKVNKSILTLSVVWVGYSLLIGIGNPSLVFLSELVQLVIAILLLNYVYYTINTKNQFSSNLRVLMVSGALLSFFEIFIYIIGEDINTSSFIGSISENYTSFYLVMTTIVIPLFFFNKKSFLYFFVVIIGFYAIYLNESRAMMLLALLFVTKEFVSFKNIYMKIAASLIAFLVILYILLTFDSALIYEPTSVFSILNFENNFSNLERLNLLLYSFELVNNNVFGYGIGSSYDLFVNNSATVNEHYPHPHNTLAFLSVELGIVGIIIYIYFFTSMVTIIRTLSDLRIKKLAVNISIALFLYSIVDVLFYNGVLMLIVFAFYGIVLSAKKIAYT